jgi:hypothetical protein
MLFLLAEFGNVLQHGDEVSQFAALIADRRK